VVSALRRIVALVSLLALASLACGESREPAPTAEERANAEAPAAAEPAPPRAEPAERRRGLWVLAEGSQRVLEHPERVPRLIEDARALGATDLFVQVYRAGRAWFDSTHADASPYRAAAAKDGGDPLAALIARAHENGLRVHAWVNVLSLATHADAPVVKAVGRDAILMDRRGRSLLDYPEHDVPQPDRKFYRLGTPGLYLDPATPGLAAHLVATFDELCMRYPALDGLHLDYIRYPDVLPFSPGSRFGVGLDFGYGERSRARFRAETGLDAPMGDSLRNADAWDRWRRERVDQLVQEIARGARAARPELAMSAAVWSYADRAYLAMGQDWRRWLDEGWLDFAVPMAYTLDDRLLRYMTEEFAGSPHRDRIWIGLGSWLFMKQPAGAREQIEIARASGAPADALFSWDSIAEAPPQRAVLAASRAERGAQRAAGERRSERGR
jgi:uncharacterized lipoprotein YddW (UPF0748 family)